MRGYLIVVLICISLMTSDRWSFGCALCKKISTQFLWPFFKLDGLLLLYCESFLYILSIDASSYAQFADFSPIFQVIFQFVNWVFLLHRSLFCFCHLYFCFCQIQKTIVKINAHSFPPPSFLQEFYDIRSYVSIFGPLFLGLSVFLILSGKSCLYVLELYSLWLCVVGYIFPILILFLVFCLRISLLCKCFEG